jgi:hypothetical protein
MVFMIVIIGMEAVLDNFHGEILNMTGVRIKISHLADHIDAAGSNMENRFVIIFILVGTLIVWLGTRVCGVVFLFLLTFLLLE